MNELVDAFRDGLKNAGVIKATEEGDGRAKRAPRPGVAKDEKPASAANVVAPATPSTGDAPSTDAPADVEAPKWKPGKAVTDQDRRHAALILSGAPSATVKIVKAFSEHREQLLKFIETLLASDEATSK
jgi:hypothetical protein